MKSQEANYLDELEDSNKCFKTIVDEQNKMFHLVYQYLDLKRAHLTGKGPLSLPVLLIWTYDKCNLKCKMCDQWRSERYNKTRILSRNEWFSVLDSAKHLKTLLVSVTGGEALLRPDIFEILEGIRDRGMACHLCTNGTTLTESNVSNLARARVRSVSVSLDSNVPKIHDHLRGKRCFHLVVEGIRRLKRNIPELKVNINFLLCKINFQQIPEMFEFSRSLGINKINLMPIHSNLQHKEKPIETFEDLLLDSNDKEKLRQLINNIPNLARKAGVRVSSTTFLKGINRFYLPNSPVRHDCYAGYVSCAISPWGEVTPCLDMDSILNVREAPLETIWHSPAFNRLRSGVRNCRRACWDTTNAELSIRCSMRGMLREFGTITREAILYR